MLPGISIGHNEHGAWGLTVFGQDNEDLYVYETNPANPNQYRHLGRWEGDDRHPGHDRGQGAGRRDGRAEVHAPRAGGLRGSGQPRRVRRGGGLAGLRLGAVPSRACAWIRRRRGRSSSRPAATAGSRRRTWSGPTRAGNIGYQAGGGVADPAEPQRAGAGAGGRALRSGDGFLPIKALPSVFNPPKGYFGTANNYTLLDVPGRYPYWEALHYTWGDQMRAARVEEVLAGARHMTVVDNMQLMMDELSVAARNLVRLLHDLPGLDGRVGPRPPAAARLGRGPRQGVGGGGDLRELGARAANGRAPHGGSRRRPRLHPGRQHETDDRLADRSGRALRRRPARGPRRPLARDPRRRARRPRRPLLAPTT